MKTRRLLEYGLSVGKRPSSLSRVRLHIAAYGIDGRPDRATKQADMTSVSGFNFEKFLNFFWNDTRGPPKTRRRARGHGFEEQESESKIWGANRL